jgi:riboflavin synthase
VFTGLIEGVGEVLAARPGDGQVELVVRPEGFAAGELALGESVAIEGVCLTVTATGDGDFTVLAGGETLARTTIGQLAAGTPVNLERALRAGDRLGGHLVQGHVDGVGYLSGRRDEGANLVLDIEVPAELVRYLAAKGSVTVDGISLTVNRVGDTSFSVALIPHTVSATTLAQKTVGAGLNLEVDILAKYVERMAAPHLAALAAPGVRS